MSENYAIGDPRHAKAVGERIRFLREQAEIDQDGFGATIGCRQTLISLHETGVRKVPVWRLRQIADFFSCPLSYLVAGEGWRTQSLHTKVPPGERARDLERSFDKRLSLALGVVGTWKPDLLPMSHLPFIIEPCRLTLLDMDQLDTGRDMLRGIKILDRIINWVEQAITYGVAMAPMLLFDACDKAVHFRCYIGLANRLLRETEPYFAKMARVIPLAKARRAEKWLIARMYARSGDVLKICTVEQPGLRPVALEHFRVAWEAAGRGHIGYYAVRSPGIVAASGPMLESEFAPYLARVDAALEAGQMLNREEMHIIEGRSEMLALRARLKEDEQGAARAVEEWAHAQRRLARLTSEHTEMRLRTERLALTLWDLGIRDHINTRGESKEVAIARMTRELYESANSSGSDRLARGLKKKVDVLRV